MIFFNLICEVVGETKTESISDSTQLSNNETRTPRPKKMSALKVFKCPMPGMIISVTHKEGDNVITGDEVCVLEAMKMQQTLKADWSGVVKKIYVKAGDQVLDGDPILELE